MSGIPSTVSAIGVQQAADILNRKAYQLIKDVAFKADSTMRDAFGRVRTSNMVSEGTKAFAHGFDDDILESIAAGSGVTTNLVNESAITLSNGGSVSGAKMTIATRKFHRYVPGRSQLVKWTGAFGVATANVRQRCGYFGNENGLFFEFDGTTLYAVRRTYTSGSVVDNRVAQSEWDDPMDGTGPSLETLDLAGGTSFLAWCDMEWLGTGRWRMGFASPTTGEFICVWSGVGSGSYDVPYMTTASLPVRFEIENTATASTLTMKWFCFSVDSEGGDAVSQLHHHSYDMGILPKLAPTGGTFQPVLAIRAKTTGPNSKTNRGQTILESVKLSVTGSVEVAFRLVLNPTTLTDSGGAITWVTTPAAAHITEYYAFDNAADTVAGGEIIGAHYLPASVQAQSSELIANFKDFPLVYTELNSVQDVFVVEAASIGSASNVLASISFTEQF